MPKRSWTQEGEVRRRLALVGCRIRKHRRSSRLTQLELARRLGFSSQKTVSRWERGDRLPDSASLLRLSLVLHAQVIDLTFPLYELYREELAASEETSA